MSRKIRNLLLASGVVVAVALLAASFLFAADVPDATIGPPTPVIASPTASQPAARQKSVENTRLYAVSLPRLQGLAATAAAGSRLELWVAWEPPITKSPRYQKLLENVILEEIVPPPIPEAPPTVLLSVADHDIGDLLYADRFGALSAVIVP